MPNPLPMTFLIMQAENLIRGNSRLAEILKVHRNTISNWKRRGFLNDAIVSQIGRTTIYRLQSIKLMSFKRPKL